MVKRERPFAVISRALPDGVTLIKVKGRLDVYNSPKLREKLVTTVTSGETRLIVDLNGAEYGDSTGIGALFGGLKKAAEHGGAMVLVCRRQRLLQHVATTRSFFITSDIASAQTALARGSIPTHKHPYLPRSHWARGSDWARQRRPLPKRRPIPAILVVLGAVTAITVIWYRRRRRAPRL